MNNRTGGYIPKSRIEKITTTLGKTIGRDKLRDGNAISDKPIQGRRVSSDNDKYLTKSEIRSIKTTDGRLIKREFIKDGNFLKNASVKHPKVSRTQFEDEEYEYADGGSVGDFVEVKLKGNRTVTGRIESLTPFKIRTDSTSVQTIPNPYIESIKKVKSFAGGGAVDSETQAKIDKIEKFINNPENQKNDPATVEKFKSILASIKPKASAPATAKVEPKPKFKVGDVLRKKNMKGDGFDNIKIEAITGWTGNEHRYDIVFLDDKLNSKNTFAKGYDSEFSTIPKLKAGRPKVASTPKATATPKATMTKKEEPQAKTSKGVKVTGSSTVTVDGKEMDMNSAEFCNYLLKQFRDRREKSKNAPKKKTASVMAKITANVEKSVVQAIKSSVASNKKEIEKNPNFFVKKVEKLETSTKSFLQSMKDVLGDDFKEGEIASTMKSIEELTESLIAKYKTK